MKDRTQDRLMKELSEKLNDKFPGDTEIKIDPDGTAEPKWVDDCIYTDGKSYDIIVMGDKGESVNIGRASYGNNSRNKIIEGNLKIPLKDGLMGNFFEKVSEYTPGSSSLTSLPRKFRFKVDYDGQRDSFGSIEDFDLDRLDYHT